jgi:hypothetical protein
MCNFLSTYYRGKQGPNFEQIIETEIKENVKFVTPKLANIENPNISRRKYLN